MLSSKERGDPLDRCLNSALVSVVVGSPDYRTLFFLQPDGERSLINDVVDGEDAPFAKRMWRSSREKHGCWSVQRDVLGGPGFLVTPSQSTGNFNQEMRRMIPGYCPTVEIAATFPSILGIERERLQDISMSVGFQSVVS